VDAFAAYRKSEVLPHMDGNPTHQGLRVIRAGNPEGRADLADELGAAQQELLPDFFVYVSLVVYRCAMQIVQ
jgi:hypothetical protein